MNPLGSEVFIEAWDKDTLSKDDLIGKVMNDYHPPNPHSHTHQHHNDPPVLDAGLHPAEPRTDVCGRLWSILVSPSAQEEISNLNEFLKTRQHKYYTETFHPQINRIILSKSIYLIIVL